MRLLYRGVLALCILLAIFVIWHKSNAPERSLPRQSRRALQRELFWNENAKRALAEEQAKIYPISALTKVESGAGIVVGEPIGPSTLKDFGAGCGRWLHLSLGGLTQFGSTPAWHETEAARRELKKNDFSLTAADAKLLAHKLGLTHVALGRLEGSASSCRLTYVWLDAKRGSLVGTPVVASGSQTAIVSQLPAVARQLASRLHAEPETYRAAGLTPVVLSDIGRWPRCSNIPLSDKETQRRFVMAQQIPLAGMLLVHNAALRNAPDYQSLTTNLLRQLPSNALAWRACGELTAKWLAKAQIQKCAGTLVDLVQSHPRNYLLLSGLARWQQARHNAAEERSSAAESVRCAMDNPNAWAGLGDAVFDESNKIRQYRYYNDLSTEQKRFVNNLYPVWLPVAFKGVTLDSRNAVAWLNLSRAAAFYGKTGLAIRAFASALKCDRQNLRIYEWGLNLFQPKWQSDSTKLKNLVASIRSDPLLYAELYGRAIEALKESGARDAAQQELNHVRSFFQQRIKQGHDPYDHYYLGQHYNYVGKYQEAVSELQTFLRLQPRNAEIKATANFMIGETLLYRSHKLKDAEVFYRRAVSIYPPFSAPFNSMGDIQQLSGNFPAAEKLYQQAIQLQPEQGFYHANLANIYFNENRQAEAVKEAKEALVLGTTEHMVFDKLGWGP